VRERNIQGIELESVFTSAEVLHSYQREFISDTFGCQVFNRYGTRELGDLASECPEHNGLHMSVENNYIEIQQNGKPVNDGQEGELVVTNLNNYGMPVIRYQIDDTGKRSQRTCPCGRGLPLLKLVQGRRVDLFKTREGKTVWGGFVSHLMAMEGIRRFQIVQESLDKVTVRIVKTDAFQTRQLAKIERVIKKAIGEETEVEFCFLDEIQVLESGKFRYTISHVDETHGVVEVQ
jgi:phenylacetate-CoA ligase